MIAKPSKLPLISTPKLGESFLNYVMRLADLNKHESPVWILNFASKKSFLPRLHYLNSCIPGVSSLTGVPQNQLQKICPTSGIGKHVEFTEGNCIPPRYSDLITPKVCPLCIEEFGQLFAFWDLRIVQVCPLHEVLLINSCYKCGVELSWKRPSLNACYCGAKYIDSEFSEVNTPLLWLAALLAKQVGFPVGLPVLEREEETAWNKASLEELVAHADIIARFLNGFCLGVTPQRNNVTVYGWNRIELIDLFTRVADVMMQWPDSLYKIIECGRRYYHTKQAISALNQDIIFQSFYDVATDHKYTKSLGLLIEALGSFACKIDPKFFVSKRGRSKVRKTIKARPRFYTKKETQEILQISSATFFRLLEKKALVGETSTMGQLIIYKVTRKSVHSYRRARKKFQVKRDIVEQLGMSRPFTEKLIASGEMEAVEGPLVDGAQQWKFNPDSKSKFMTRIEQHYEPMFLPEESFINFLRMYDIVTRCGLGWDRFLNAILNGDIRPRRLSSSLTTLNRFLFCEWDVRLAVQQIKTGSEDIRLHCSRVEIYLGTNSKLLFALLERSGRLPRHKSKIFFSADEVRWLAMNCVSHKTLMSFGITDRGCQQLDTQVKKSDMYPIAAKKEDRLYKPSVLLRYFR